MNKGIKRLGAAVLASVMVLMAGCSSKTHGKSFVTINDVSYNEDEMYANIYYSIGNSFSGIIDYNETADAKEIRETIDALYDNESYGDYVNKQKIAYVKQKVCDEKLLSLAKEQNVALNEEEQAKVDQEYNSVVDFFNSEDTLTQVKEQMYSDSTNADSEAKKYLEGYKKFYLSLYSVENIEKLKDKYNELALINKVLELKSDEVPDDEEYVKQYYNELVEEQKAAYAEDPSAFDADYDYGEVICYYPSGLRYVRHILVKYTDQELEQYTQLESQISQLESKENRTEEENTTLTNAKNSLSQVSQTMDNRVKARADEAYAKINSGTDFETVLTEYGEDASMTDASSLYKDKGYLVSSSSDMVKEFLDVAMALKKPGDISKPVKSSYGYHIIKYVEKGKEGTVAYEDVRDELLTVAMEEKKKEVLLDYYDKLFEEMLASGQVKVNYDVLGFNKETFDKLYDDMKNTSAQA